MNFEKNLRQETEKSTQTPLEIYFSDLDPSLGFSNLRKNLCNFA